MTDELLEKKTTASIISAFYEVYNVLGFGFLEQTYSLALERELRARGHKVDRECTIVVYYKGEPLNRHRLDFVVDEKVVVENKSTVKLPLHTKRQLSIIYEPVNSKLDWFFILVPRRLSTV